MNLTTTNKDQIGNNYEIDIAKRYNDFGVLFMGKGHSPLFPFVHPTKDLNSRLDHDLKVDISTMDPADLKDFGLVIQAKSTSSSIKYPKILATLKQAAEEFDAIPIVYHKQVQRDENLKEKKSRGEYVILNATDFEAMWFELKQSRYFITNLNLKDPGK